MDGRYEQVLCFLSKQREAALAKKPETTLATDLVRTCLSRLLEELISAGLVPDTNVVTYMSSKQACICPRGRTKIKTKLFSLWTAHFRHYKLCSVGLGAEAI